MMEAGSRLLTEMLWKCAMRHKPWRWHRNMGAKISSHLLLSMGDEQHTLNSGSHCQKVYCVQNGIYCSFAIADNARTTLLDSVIFCAECDLHRVPIPSI